MADANVNLTLTNQAFVAGLNDAQQKAQGFEQRVSGLFRRSPLARAEHAFADLAANLSTGNVAQGIAGFAGRMTGLGLAAGVGVGAAIAVFHRFKGEADATAKAVQAVNVELHKPISAQIGLGAAALTASIEGENKLLEDLVKKRESLGSRLSEAFSKAAKLAPEAGALSAGEPVPPRPKGGINDIEVTSNAEVQAQLEERIRQLVSARADAEVAAVQAKIKGLQFSELEGRIAERATATEKARSEIILQESRRRIGPGTDQLEDIRNISKRLGAVRDLAAAQDAADRQAADVKSRELDIDKEIAAEALRGVSAEDQKVSRLRQELALIQSQLNGEAALTAEKRKQLETTQAKTQAELAAAKAAQSGRPLLTERDIHERAKLGISDIAAGTGAERISGSRLLDQQRLQQDRIQAEKQGNDLEAERIRGEEAKMFGPGATARQALRDEQLSRQAALQGNLPLAESFFGLSDKLREGIPGLKNAEKPLSLADAMKGPEIVKELQNLNTKFDAAWGR